ncbi:MAG: exosortase/archaeosortase family protein [Armatimonadota bacterium]
MSYLGAKTSHYSAVVGWAAISALMLWQYGQDVFTMASRWANEPEASHGFLVPFASAALVWWKRRQLASTPRFVWGWGLVPLIFGLGLTVLAESAQVAFLRPVAMLIVVGGILLYAFGPKLFARISFPYAFLYFMIPWPNFLVEMISFPLQLLTSTYAAMIAGLFGIPIRREGIGLYAPGFSVTVAAACSGIRSLMAIMALAAVFAYLTKASWWKRGLLFLCGIPVALTANVIRVVLVLFIGTYWSKQIAVGMFHDYSSPVLVGLCSLLMIALQKAISECPRQTTC